MTDAVALEARGVSMSYPVRAGLLQRRVASIPAVVDASFSVRAGQTIGVVGESGCGKSTLARTLVGLLRPTAGSIRLHGTDISGLPEKELRPLRRQIQMVFQDPFGSLNPRMTVGEILAEPYRAHRVASAKAAVPRVQELLEVVGLAPEHISRYPHEFSGGQRQRIGIARALALEPSVVVLDEPVSALDVSVKADIVTLLDSLRSQRSLAYVFIAHDLAIVSHIADDVAVMYLGRIVEVGPKHTIYRRPRHPYTEALLGAVPVANPSLERQRKKIVLQGEVPNPAAPPSGCAFRTRCPKATDLCAASRPALVELDDGRSVACHFPLE